MKIGQLKYSQMLVDWLKSENYNLDRVFYLDHHSMHAASAYFGSGFDRALVFTADGQGDGKTATLSLWDRGRPSLVNRATPVASLLALPAKVFSALSSTSLSLGLPTNVAQLHIVGP